MISVSSDEKSGTVAKAIKLIVANLEKLRDQMKVKIDETDARITRLEQKVIQLAKTIENLENQVSVVQFSPPPTPKVTESSEVVELKDELESMKNRFSKIEEELQNQIKTLQEKIDKLEKEKFSLTTKSLTQPSSPEKPLEKEPLIPKEKPTSPVTQSPPPVSSPPKPLTSSAPPPSTIGPTIQKESRIPAPAIPTNENEPKETEKEPKQKEEEASSFIPPISGEMNEDQKALMEALKKLENL